jgi:hypothetical protein
MPQGLIPSGYSRFDIASGYAAFGDWWNKDGLTARCHDKGRSISCTLHRMRYSPGMGDYLDGPAAVDVYLGLVKRYYPERCTHEELELTFRDSFQKPQIEATEYFIVRTTVDDEVIPADVIGRTCATHVEALLNYLEGDPRDDDELVPIKHGWLARLSAPGYMDCTEWSAHDSWEDAAIYLINTYGDRS